MGIILAIGIGGQELALMCLLIVVAYWAWKEVVKTVAKQEGKDKRDKKGPEKPSQAQAQLISSLPFFKQLTAIALRIVFCVLIILTASDIYYIGCFLFTQVLRPGIFAAWSSPSFAALVYQDNARHFWYKNHTEPHQEVQYFSLSFAPSFFLILLCLGGIGLALSEAARLNALPDSVEVPKRWLIVGAGFAILAALFLMQQATWSAFGVPFSVLESLGLTLSLIAINRLAWWILIKHPEDAAYLSKPVCIFIATFLALVTVTWLFYILNFSAAYGVARILAELIHPDSQNLAHEITWWITVISAPWLIPSVSFFGYLAVLAHHREQYKLPDVVHTPTNVVGVIKMKVLKNNKWIEEDEVAQQTDGSPQSLIVGKPGSILFRESPEDTSSSTSLSIVDRVKSKYTSVIQSRIIEDQTKVTEAQAKAIEAQKKAMEQKVSLIETATKGQRAQTDYELLPEERKVKEIGFDVSQSELRLKQMELEMKRKQLCPSGKEA